MVQTGSNDSSLRLMGMLMTISLGIFAVLFLYVLYNMTVNVAGTTIAMLFFIVLAFFIVLMKTFKLLNRLANPTPNLDYDLSSSIPTISEIVSSNRVRHESLPPSYEEAIRNYAQKVSMNSTAEECIINETIPKPSGTHECPRCSSSQVPVN
ncbi:hypothetical protein V9T40_014519 [Parthenolecanium corni]|uniref:Uncharacterized protein n=1 Tax=Parthenolecanium corni TaxID=536013 RepID=A0AAN9T536_9HEMI